MTTHLIARLAAKKQEALHQMKVYHIWIMQNTSIFLLSNKISQATVLTS